MPKQESTLRGLVVTRTRKPKSLSWTWLSGGCRWTFGTIPRRSFWRDGKSLGTEVTDVIGCVDDAVLFSIGWSAREQERQVTTL